MKMGIKNFKQVFKALKQAYGNKYAWTEVKDVLNSEGQSLNISEEDIHGPFKNLRNKGTVLFSYLKSWLL